jgi:hypothetical protein
LLKLLYGFMVGSWSICSGIPEKGNLTTKSYIVVFIAFCSVIWRLQMHAINRFVVSPVASRCSRSIYNQYIHPTKMILYFSCTLWFRLHFFIDQVYSIWIGHSHPNRPLSGLSHQKYRSKLQEDTRGQMPCLFSVRGKDPTSLPGQVWTWIVLWSSTEVDVII